MPRHISAGNGEARRARVDQRRACRWLQEKGTLVSCLEAGRDGFWPHRFLEKQGIENIVIDAASMKVSRHGRGAKNDSIDVKQLLRDLVRFHRGDDDVRRVVRVPSEEAEDDRRPHRELGGWCKTPILLRPAIKSPLHGGRSPQSLDVSIDTPALSGFASDRTYATFLRASRRSKFYTSHLGSCPSWA